MSYLTDLKRATGHGSARQGTLRHWGMTKSSVALLILTPFFVWMVGSMLGRPHEEVVAYFARPFPALVVAGMLAVGLMHFKNGIQMVIEDYTGGLTREVLIVLTICLSYGAAATGLFALLKIAL